MADDDPFALAARRLVCDGDLLRCWPLQGGVSASLHALEIGQPDGTIRRVVLRRHRAAEWKALTPDVTAREYALLEALHRMGMTVPRALLLDESGEIFPTPYLVIEYVEGTTHVNEAQLPEALGQMADFLARLHAQDPEDPGLASLPDLEDPFDGIRELLPPGPLADRLRVSLRGTATITNGRRSLLHGDFWPGNLLWHSGRLASVIDWEDAALGDPLSDLACCRVELLCAYDEAAMETFTRNYLERSALDPSDLALWELYVSSAALASMSEWGLAPRVEAHRRRRTSLFLERAAREWLSRAT